MALRDTIAFVISTEGAAEQLPDPSVIFARVHQLVNNSNGACVWSAVGAGGFTLNGVNSPTLTVPAGNFAFVRPAAGAWQVLAVGQSVPGRRVFAGTGVTDGAGNVTFTFTPAFAAPPVVSVAIQETDGAVYFHRVTSRLAGSCTVHIDRSVSVSVLGIGVLALQTNANGRTVNLIATEAGQGV